MIKLFLVVLIILFFISLFFGYSNFRQNRGKVYLIVQNMTFILPRCFLRIDYDVLIHVIIYNNIQYIRNILS